MQVYVFTSECMHVLIRAFPCLSIYSSSSHAQAESIYNDQEVEVPAHDLEDK
jgi:hypothetical protein